MRGGRVVSRPYSSSSCLGIHLRVVFFFSTPFSPIHFGMETNESALQQPAERSLFSWPSGERMNCPTLLTNYEVVRESVSGECEKGAFGMCSIGTLALIVSLASSGTWCSSG